MFSIASSEDDEEYGDDVFEEAEDFQEYPDDISLLSLPPSSSSFIFVDSLSDLIFVYSTHAW